MARGQLAVALCLCAVLQHQGVVADCLDPEDLCHMKWDSLEFCIKATRDDCNELGGEWQGDSDNFLWFFVCLVLLAAIGLVSIYCWIVAAEGGGAQPDGHLAADLGSSVSVITLTREADEPLGIKHVAGKEFVVELKVGSLVEKWNSEHPACQARYGDRVVEVNGVVEVATMLEQLKKERVLSLKLVCPGLWLLGSDSFTITLAKEADEPLGIKHIKDKELIVEVRERSLVEKWNRENSGSQAKLGDHAVQVNEATVLTDMVEQLKTQRTLSVKLRRKVSPRVQVDNAGASRRSADYFCNVHRLEELGRNVLELEFTAVGNMSFGELQEPMHSTLHWGEALLKPTNQVLQVSDPTNCYRGKLRFEVPAAEHLAITQVGFCYSDAGYSTITIQLGGPCAEMDVMEQLSVEEANPQLDMF